MRPFLALFLLASPAWGQDYTPPSRELWTQMVQALQQIPMSLNSHRQVQQILDGVQQQAAAEAARAKQEKAK